MPVRDLKPSLLITETQHQIDIWYDTLDWTCAAIATKYLEIVFPSGGDEDRYLTHSQLYFPRLCFYRFLAFLRLSLLN